MAKFFVCTFGCRCNQADSAAIRDSLCSHAMSEGETSRDSDIVVINTCTVTHRSDQQIRQAIRRMHRENPAARLIVTGCYAERDPETLAAIEGVDLVIGNGEKERLAEILNGGSEQSQGRIINSPLEASRDYLLPAMTHTGGKTRPLVKIQDGCDANCSYCIVPQVRGPGRSAKTEDVLAEINSLVTAGFHEIVLTGIHLGAFGRSNRQGQRMLSGLLREIVAIPGLGRVRLSSIEPMELDDSIIALAAANPLIAGHFHVPMQSGSDRILGRMRRPYTAARLASLFNSIRTALPDAGLGTDVMVGFPGETDDDFDETCKLVREAPLTYLHVFPFSPRQGTDAWSMPDRVPSGKVKQRLGTLLEVSRAKNLAFRNRFIGHVLPAITLSQEEGLGTSIVLTSNYIHARIPGLMLEPNQLVNIRIEEVQPAATLGSVAAI